MTYQELVEKVKVAYNKAKAVEITEHIAVQVNVEGEASGIFYFKVADGALDIQPYDYRDHDVLVIASTDVISDVADGKLSIEDAYAKGSIKVEGNLGKAALLKQVELKKAVKKAAPKKTAAKAAEVKEAPKKAAAKTVAKKAETKVEEPVAKKAEVKETTAKKAAETKTAAKEAEKKVETKAAEVKETATKKAAVKTTAKKASK